MLPLVLPRVQQLDSESKSSGPPARPPAPPLPHPGLTAAPIAALHSGGALVQQADIEGSRNG